MRVTAVLLAAGGSRRLGRPKQLLPWRGEALVRHAARAALGCGADETLVVVGAHEDAVRAALAELPLRIVPNPDWEDGLASSLRVGAQAARHDALLVVLADQPHVDAALLAALVDAGRAGATRVACDYAGRAGVPAFFAHGDELHDLSRDRGARDLLQDPSVPRIPFPAGTVDIDTEEDWQELLQADASDATDPAEDLPDP